MTTLRSRIHTESTCGSAVSILANLFVYRCHFGISFESLRNFVSPTLLSLVISQILLCFQSARVPTGKQSVLPEMTNHTPVRSDELRIDFERRSIDTQTYATVVEAGGERVCVRQGFMALCVKSSLSFGVPELFTLRYSAPNMKHANTNCCRDIVQSCHGSSDVQPVLAKSIRRTRPTTHTEFFKL